jgi:hypothetical protein
MSYNMLFCHNFIINPFLRPTGAQKVWVEQVYPFNPGGATHFKHELK